MRRLTLLVSFLLWAAPSWAAQPTSLGAGFSTSTTSFDSSTGAYTGFTTCTVGAGSSRALVLFLGTGDEVFTGASVVTWGGQSLTAVTGYLKDDTMWTTVQAWYLLEAGIAGASGNTFSVTIAGASHVVDQLLLGCAAWSGVDQGTPFGTTITNTATSTTPTTNSLTLTADQIGIGSMVTDDDSAFTENNTALFTKLGAIGSDSGMSGQSRTTTGALTWTTASFSYASAAVPLNGISAGGGATASRLPLLGVGP